MTVRGLMRDVIIALVPACVAGIYFFGYRAALLMATCVITALLTEYACRKLMRRENTLGDLSAALTGLLLALNLPSGLPLWQAALGTVVAIAIAKQVFGGLGYNPFNPALVGRAFLLISFTAAMTTWTPSDWRSTDAITTATPLSAVKGAMRSAVADGDGAGVRGQGLGVSDTTTTATVKSQESDVERRLSDVESRESEVEHRASDVVVNSFLPSGIWTWRVIGKMFIGDINGSLGETSALALLLGGLYLLCRRVIRWIVPVSYLLTVAIGAVVINLCYPAALTPVWIHLFSGGLMLGAWFMATDPVTTPVTRNGMLIFGIGCGLLTLVIRMVPSGLYPEGTSFAILIMNAFAPLINKVTHPRKFGRRKK